VCIVENLNEQGQKNCLPGEKLSKKDTAKTTAFYLGNKEYQNF
jgi:hypothetical protein